MVGAELLKNGQLELAMKRVAEEVRSKPADQAMRTFYFELLCLSGDLDRAAKQLEVLSMTNADIALGATTYQLAIGAEKQRRAFFHGGPRPRLLEPAPYAETYLLAIQRHASGDFEAAASLLSGVEATSGPLDGTLNGLQISKLQDAYDLLGPFLEVVMDGCYTWIGWDTVHSLSIPQPRYLRDTLWAPATVTLNSGSHGEVLVFVLYPDSHLHSDEQVRLGHMTVWESNDAGYSVAFGQKVLTTGENDHALLDIRDLEVTPCPSPA